jgi:hypothetical protein
MKKKVVVVLLATLAVFATTGSGCSNGWRQAGRAAEHCAQVQCVPYP